MRSAAPAPRSTGERPGARTGGSRGPQERAQRPAGRSGSRSLDNYPYRMAKADGSARILLVDDEQSIQTLLTYPLRKDGYEVVAALDGREALDRFAEQRFDLV